MLDQPLSLTEPSAEVKQLIAAELWDTPSSEVVPSCNPYFRYYVKQCELIALHESGSHVFVRTHQDILQIVRLLREGRSRQEILSTLSQPLTGRRSDFSIDLAARLLSMMEFGRLPYAYSGFRQLEWDNGSLQEYLADWYGQKPVLGHDNIKLEKIFNARNLGKIAGIEIAWTTNLADHLRLMKDDRVVAIFHHASFLKHQERDSSLYSASLIKEAFDTISLLFPKWDKATRSWYQQEASLRGLDPYLIEVGHLDADQRQIENFSHWHDRLVVLKQVFNEARPSTLQQWWNDRRNGVQWYTFWVAVLVLLLTVFFGLVQSVEGALQVYKAFHPE